MRVTLKWLKCYPPNVSYITWINRKHMLWDSEKKKSFCTCSVWPWKRFSLWWLFETLQYICYIISPLLLHMGLRAVVGQEESRWMCGESRLPCYTATVKRIILFFYFSSRQLTVVQRWGSQITVPWPAARPQKDRANPKKYTSDWTQLKHFSLGW